MSRNNVSKRSMRLSVVGWTRRSRRSNRDCTCALLQSFEDVALVQDAANSVWDLQEGGNERGGTREAGGKRRDA